MMKSNQSSGARGRPKDGYAKKIGGRDNRSRKSSGDRPSYSKDRSDRPPRPSGERPSYGGDRKEYPRKPSGDRPSYNKDKGKYPPRKPSGDRKEYPRKPKPRPADGSSFDGPERTVSIRQIVLRILTDFDNDPGDPERIADKVLSRRRIDDRDRRFVFELVYGVLRNRMYLDYVIDSFLPEGRTLDNEIVRRILRMGAYQVLFLDRVPDHAAVNESVNLAKRDNNTAMAAGFVNAIMRNVIKGKHGITLPDPQTDLCGRLSIEFSHPKWMIERWMERYGLSDTKKILTFNNERPAVFLRRKTRDMPRQQFESDVRTLCEPGCGFLNLYYKMRKHLDPESLRLLQGGFCSVQAPSSGWVVAMMDLRMDESVADLCCAPGGKTTLMAELVGDAGAVLACDRSRRKMGMVMDAVRAQGLKNILPMICDSAQPPFTGHFDKVLLDAPCSGTGVMQRHPEARFVRTIEDITNSQAVQRQLLDSAAKMVGENGVIVYSTCSLEPEENEDQVKWFLDNHPEFGLDDPPDTIPAMFIDDNKCLRITPFEHNMDGMFAVRFCKA